MVFITCNLGQENPYNLLADFNKRNDWDLNFLCMFSRVEL